MAAAATSILKKHILPCDKKPTRSRPGEKWIRSTPEKQGINSDKLHEAPEFLESKCGKDGYEEAMMYNARILTMIAKENLKPAWTGR